MTNLIDTSPRRGRAAPSFLAASCIGFLVVPGVAVAQQTGDDQGATRLGRVTVTDTAIDDSYNRAETSSDKQTAELVNTPQTVSVIPQEIIRERGATNLTEVLRNTPGISFNAGENGFATSTSNFQLRGFDTSGNIFIDGTRDSGAYSRDVFNIEQVEVFKGASSDNGRGGAGGYVNLVTKVPTLESFIGGNLAFGFDQYGTRARLRGTVDVNQVVSDGIAIRLNAVGERSGVAGRDVAERNLWGIAPSIAVGLNGPLRAYLSYEHTSGDDIPDWGVPGASIPGLITYNPLTDGVDRDNFYGLASDFDDVDTDAVLFRVEYDAAPGITLSNQTRWAQVDRFARYTVPTAFVPATLTVNSQTQFYERDNETLTNLTNLRASFNTGAVAHTLSAGLEFTRERSNASRYGTANQTGNDLFNPDPNRVPAPALAPTQFNEVDIDTIAFYLFDTIELSEQFQITGGIRGENYDVEIVSTDIAGVGTGAVDGYDDSRFSWSGRLGLVYKPAPDGSIYVSWGTSAQSPGSFLSNPDISRTGDNAFPGFVPGARAVRSDNYEIGVRWNFMDGALSTSIAGFRTEKRRVPVVGRQPGDTADSLQGYHRQIVQGVELGITGQLTPEWQIFAGALIMDSERQISAELNEARRLANPGDYGTFTTVDGDRLAFTPNFTANLWTTYRFPFGLTVGGGLQHVGSSYLGRPDDAIRFIPNGQFGKLPSYTLVNALISYELTPNIDLRLNVDNLFNEQYAISTNWPGTRASLGAPRTFLVSAGFRF
ncbi:MAG: TonB-dependent siderophore receptor [Sphingomonas sp.]|nr:TonB-dependent siderophore receptor [Sphingomonas sp.]